MLSSFSSSRAALVFLVGAALLHCSFFVEASPNAPLSSKAFQDGSDISLIGAGKIEVILQNDQLVFEVCPRDCTKKFLVCFEGDSGNPDATIKQCEGKCGLSINADEEMIGFMKDAQRGTRKVDGCVLIPMVNGSTFVRDNSGDEFDTAETCLPKLDGEKKVKLNLITVDDKCPVSIKNAYIAPPPPPTATMTPSITGTTAAAPGDFALKYGWIILVASLLFLVLVVGSVILAVSYCAKRKAKKASLPKHVKAKPNDAPQMIKVVPNAAAPQIVKAMPNAAPDLPPNVRIKPRTKKAEGERWGAPLYNIKKKDEERLFPNGMK